MVLLSYLGLQSVCSVVPAWHNSFFLFHKNGLYMYLPARHVVVCLSAASHCGSTLCGGTTPLSFTLGDESKGSRPARGEFVCRFINSLSFFNLGIMLYYDKGL